MSGEDEEKRSQAYSSQTDYAMVSSNSLRNCGLYRWYMAFNSIKIG